jgi:hypothetical protein
VSVYSLLASGLRLRANFFGINDVNFRGGARASVGDLDGDGVPDLAVSAGFGGGPRVALYHGTTLFGGTPAPLTNDFFAFPGAESEGLRNGVYLAVADVDTDGFGDLIFGAGPGGGPRVYVLSGRQVLGGDLAGAYANPLANFFVAGNVTDRGGVRVAAKDVDGDGVPEVVTGTGEGQASGVRIYSGTALAGTVEPDVLQDLDPFGRTLTDGVFVG